MLQHPRGFSPNVPVAPKAPTGRSDVRSRKQGSDSTGRSFGSPGDEFANPLTRHRARTARVRDDATGKELLKLALFEQNCGPISVFGNKTNLNFCLYRSSFDVTINEYQRVARKKGTVNRKHRAGGRGLRECGQSRVQDWTSMVWVRAATSRDPVPMGAMVALTSIPGGADAS